MGGLGIIIPSQLCATYYKNSKAMTAPLVNRIINQYTGISEEGEYNVQEVKDKIKAEKTEREKSKMEFVKSHINPQQLRILEATSEKGASSWLSTLPLKAHNFYLNKQTFWDTIYLRFGIPIPRLPTNCVCGLKFSIEHALTCKKGGFISIRHNDLRDFTAEILDEIHNDVSIEPLLIPLTGENFKYKSAKTEVHARLDLAARGVFIKGNRAFFDLRVFNPLAPFYGKMSLAAAHSSNENSKKREYNERVLQVEHGSFTPLVFSCLGGMSVECSNFYNRISDRLAEKRNIEPSRAKSWLRTKLNFCLLRTTNMCIRGSRTKLQEKEALKDTNIQMAMVDARITE